MSKYRKMILVDHDEHKALRQKPPRRNIITVQSSDSPAARDDLLTLDVDNILRDDKINDSEKLLLNSQILQNLHRVRDDVRKKQKKSDERNEEDWKKLLNAIVVQKEYHQNIGQHAENFGGNDNANISNNHTNNSNDFSRRNEEEEQDDDTDLITFSGTEDFYTIGSNFFDDASYNKSLPPTPPRVPTPPEFVIPPIPEVIRARPVQIPRRAKQLATPTNLSSLFKTPIPKPQHQVETSTDWSDLWKTPTPPEQVYIPTPRQHLTFQSDTSHLWRTPKILVPQSVLLDSPLPEQIPPPRYSSTPLRPVVIQRVPVRVPKRPRTPTPKFDMKQHLAKKFLMMDPYDLPPPPRRKAAKKAVNGIIKLSEEGRRRKK